jgi:hypothetical protein
MSAGVACVIPTNQRREETRMPANVRPYAAPATLVLPAVLGRLSGGRSRHRRLQATAVEMAFTLEGDIK